MKRKFSSKWRVALATAMVITLGLVTAVPAMAGAPTIVLTTPGGGITSLTGTPTGSGTEAGAHSIVITDATASTLDGVAVEHGTTESTIVNTLAGTEVLTVTIAGDAITTGALAATTAGTTLLTDVATDIQTKINAATTAADVTVTVVDAAGVSNGYFVITVNLAGANNSVTTQVTGNGAAPTGLGTNTPVVGTDAKAVDTLAAATGSNGLWVAANGASKTIAHSPTAGTASDLAGLKALVIPADAFIEGITLAASGVLGAGTATVTVTAGAASLLVIATQPAGSVSGIALTTQPILEAQDDSGNVDLTYITNVVASEDDLGALTGTLTVTPTAGVATFAGLIYTATADQEVFQIDFASSGITGVTSANVTCDVVATKLVIVTQPDGAVSSVNLVLQPVINAVDADGTLDAGWTAACTVVKESGTGTVTGGPVGTMSTGVATFTDVNVTESPVTHDSYTLRFASGALTYVVSDAFKVYDKILDLNNNAWTLISTDDYIISSGDDTSAFEGTVSLKYVYTGSSYVSAFVTDIEPVEALYVKTTGSDGLVGLNYSTTASPGASIKALLAGWNLVSSATSTASNAVAVLSPIRYVQIGEQQGVGLTTLVSQNSYNLNTGDFYIPTLIEANWTGTPLTTTTLDAFDGYWVYMNAAKSFGVIPQ